MKIIFDTNAYRTFVRGKSSDEALAAIKEVVEKQNQKGVQSLMVTTVAKELICRLYDNGNFDSEGECTKALRVLYAHCGDNSFYHALPEPCVQIARDLFKSTDHKTLNTQKVIAKICRAICANPIKSEADKYKSEIDQIKRHNEEVENETGMFFDALAGIWRTSPESEDKKAELVCNISALAFLLAIADKNGIQYPQTNDQNILMNHFFNEVGIYKSQYSAPLKMRENFVRKLSNPKFNPNKPERINMVWDEQVLHSCHQTIDDDCIVIVTSDKGMLEAGRQTAPVSGTTAGLVFPEGITTLDDYLAWLG